LTVLDWRHAKREDREALKQFTCTGEGRRERGIAWSDWMLVGVVEYERRVQARIRDFKPPTGGPCSMLLGEEAGTIAAVVHITSGAEVNSIDMLGVSSDAQRQGLGREALNVALDELSLTAQEAGKDHLNVYVDVHADNYRASQLFASQEFARAAQHSEGYHRWVARIVI
jgi:ribosomal protein S18 acetylase RimI-like enzyme